MTDNIDANVTIKNAHKDLIKIVVYIIITLLIIFRIILPYTIFKYKPHKNEFNEQKHIIVTKAIIQERKGQNDDYDEFEIPEVWYSPTEDNFYSIHDKWLDQHLNKHNRSLLLINYFFGLLIVILLMLKYHFTENSINYSFLCLKQICNIPTVRYGVKSIFVMIIIVTILNFLSLSAIRSPRAVDSNICNNELYQKYTSR